MTRDDLERERAALISRRRRAVREKRTQAINAIDARLRPIVTALLRMESEAA